MHDTKRVVNPSMSDLRQFRNNGQYRQAERLDKIKIYNHPVMQHRSRPVSAASGVRPTNRVRFQTYQTSNTLYERDIAFM